MAWKIEISPGANKEIEKLDKPLRGEIKKYLYEYVANLTDPRSVGKALKGNLRGFWRYSFRKDYRIICDIQDETIIIFVVEIGHRKNVYEKKKKRR